MSGDKLHKQHCLELLVDRLLECLLETQFNEQLVVDFHGSFASCCEILRLIVSDQIDCYYVSYILCGCYSNEIYTLH